MNYLLNSKINKFKNNKRGYYSFIIFVSFFIITLLAEFIANEDPLLVRYKGELYFPIFKSYPETTFGGDFETKVSFYDESILDAIKKEGFILRALIPYSIQSVNYALNKAAPSKPDKYNWLGTDDQGRDILTRLLYGFRTSILFGLLLTIGTSIIGVILGAVQGYFGGYVDLIAQRFIEIWSNLPLLYLLMILSSIIEPSFSWLLIIMILFSWTSIVGVVRAEFFRIRALDYVKSAQALGMSDANIIFKQILPNAMVATITYLPFILNGSIVMLTSLDFLGFGLSAGSASLGELIIQAKNNIHAPWIGISVFLSISFILSLLIFIGEAIRDVFDPRAQ